MSTRTRNRLLLLTTAVLFSTGGAAIKATSLAGWQVASFRSLIAAATVLALVPAARRDWSPRVALTGVAYAATLVLFVLANKLTTAASAIYLQATAPIYVLVLSVWVLREPVRRADLLLAAIVAAGLSMFFIGREPALVTAPNPAYGNLLAAGSGLTWALTVSGLRWLGRQPTAGNPATATVAAGNLIAAVACLPMALPASNLGWHDALVLLYLGVFQIGLAYWFLTLAIRHVPAFEAATLLLVEPALNPIWAWLVHGERPGPWALSGGILILGASFAHTWWQERRRAAAASP